MTWSSLVFNVVESVGFFAKKARGLGNAISPSLLMNSIQLTYNFVVYRHVLSYVFGQFTCSNISIPLLQKE
jgi:hypothetical protein